MHVRKDYNNKIIITSCNDVMKSIQETKQANKNIRKQKFIYLHNSCNSYLWNLHNLYIFFLAWGIDLKFYGFL